MKERNGDKEGMGKTEKKGNKEGREGKKGKVEGKTEGER